MAALPPERPIDANAIEVLDNLLARAFGIEGGYRELNGIVSADNAAGYDMFEYLGLHDSPMAVVVPAVRKAVQAKGPNCERACLQALLLHLPGNFELREWITNYCPGMLWLVPQQTFEVARAVYDQDRLERRVRVMSRSLTRLAPEMELRPDQKALARRMIRKLNELNDYKTIHDTLHGLQGGTLLELSRTSSEQIIGMERRMSLTVQTQELQVAEERIAQRFAYSGAPELAVTLRDLSVSAIDELVKLLEQSDLEAHETSEGMAGLLRASLRKLMGPLDSKLVETVNEIPFGEFASMLRDLPIAAGGPAKGPSGDPILAANVGASFEDIQTRLIRRRTVHTLWQQVDATLHNAEELLRGTGREIELRQHLKNLAGLVDQIGVLSVEHGQFTLPKPAGPNATPAEFVKGARSDAYRRVFDFFAREARARFQRADNAMLNDCEALERLQQALRDMVGD